VLRYLKTHPVLSSVLGFFFLLFLFTYWIFWSPNTSAASPDLRVTVPRGASFTSVADSLESNGILKSRWTFDLAGRILGLTRDIKVGKYQFPRGLSNVQILRDLSEGTSRVKLSVLVPEGWRIERIAIRYAQVLGIDTERFINLCRSERFTRSLGIESETLEGYLMPDTYRFFWQTEEEEIIETMVNAFKAFYVDSLVRRQEELKMSLNEVLTLASIVEGETSLDSERATIAGVYHNRLKKRMRLEADPTIQYIISDGPRRLFYSDLRIESPFNTYRIYGLPPAPIGSPGRKSIIAALYPKQHSYFFFVADGNGGHRFSRTYAEHQRAVREWRRIRREALQNALATPSGG